jgi:hypothetical protein
MSEPYTSPEFGAALGIDSYPAAIAAMGRFSKEGWLKPSIRESSGSGGPCALYSEEDLKVARIVLDVIPMEDHGAGAKIVKAKRARAADVVRRHHKTAKFIAFNDDHIWVGDDAKTLWRFAKDLGTVTVICLEYYNGQ